MRGGKCKPSAPCEKRQGRSSPSGGLRHATRTSEHAGRRGAAGCARRLQGSRMGICQHGCPSPPKVSVGRVSREPGRSARAGRILPASGSAALCSANRHSEPCPRAARASLLPEKIGLQEPLTLRLKLSSSTCDAGSVS